MVVENNESHLIRLTFRITLTRKDFFSIFRVSNFRATKTARVGYSTGSICSKRTLSFHPKGRFRKELGIFDTLLEKKKQNPLEVLMGSPSSGHGNIINFLRTVCHFLCKQFFFVSIRNLGFARLALNFDRRNQNRFPHQNLTDIMRLVEALCVRSSVS